MNFNATLIGQSVTFAVFVWFCLKYIWPPIMAVLEERRQKIADGLAAADRGVKSEAKAKAQAEDILKEAKEQARLMIAQAQKRHDEMVDQAKAVAKEEEKKIIELSQDEIQQQVNRAREELRTKLVDLTLSATSKILEREVNAKDHEAWLKKFSANL